MSCEHNDIVELAAGVVLCRACGKVGVNGRFAPIGMPVRTPCCTDCLDRIKNVMDEHARRQGCQGCGKSKK